MWPYMEYLVAPRSALAGRVGTRPTYENDCDFGSHGEGGFGFDFVGNGRAGYCTSSSGTVEENAGRAGDGRRFVVYGPKWFGRASTVMHIDMSALATSLSTQEPASPHPLLLNKF